MKHRAIAIVSGLLLLAALAASGGTIRSSPPSYRAPAPVSRPSASTLYNKPPSVTPRAPATSSGGYFKPSPPPKVSSFGGYTKPPSSTSNPAQAPSPRPVYPQRQTLTEAQQKQSSTAPSPALPKGITSSGGYSRPGTAPAASTAPKPSAPTAFAKGNRFDQDASRKLQAEKSRASFTAFKAEQDKFKTPPVKPEPNVIKNNPVVTNTRVYTHVGYDDVVRRREVHFTNWHPPVVIYQSAPSYGSWSSTFLWWSLMNDSSFFYHHRSDPSIAAWHNDAVRLAEQNGELKAQVAALDKSVDEMRTKGAPVNDKYLPKEVEKDPLVALSSEAVSAIPVEKPTLRVATGIRGGSYAEVGELLKRRSAEVKIELVSTSGAEENLKLLRSGKVDAAIVQSDTDYVMDKDSAETPKDVPTFHRATLYSEYVMCIVSKDSPIQSVKDLGAANTVYVGPDGSGSALTWNSFGMQNARYKEVKFQHTDYSSAFEKVGADKTKALLFVAGMNTPLLSAARQGQYRLVPVDDDNLSSVRDKSGDVVYDVLTLPSGTYPGLQGAELTTLGVDAEWTISDRWIEKVGPEAFDQVNYAVIDVVGDLHKKPEPVSSISKTTPSQGESHWFRNLFLLGICGGGLYWLVFKKNFT